MNIIQQEDEKDIRRELEGEPEDLDEDRSVGTKDEDDDDPDDTTPNEATEQADEGEELVKKEQRRHQTHDEFEDYPN